MKKFVVLVGSLGRSSFSLIGLHLPLTSIKILTLTFRLTLPNQFQKQLRHQTPPFAIGFGFDWSLFAATSSQRQQPQQKQQQQAQLFQQTSSTGFEFHTPFATPFGQLIVSFNTLSSHLGGAPFGKMEKLRYLNDDVPTNVLSRLPTKALLTQSRGAAAAIASEIAGLLLDLL